MGGPHIVFGAGGIGKSPAEWISNFDTPESVTSLLTLLQSLGITELDSAANYPPRSPWQTNTLLGQVGAATATAATADHDTSSSSSSSKFSFQLHDKVHVPANYETGEKLPSLRPDVMARNVDKSFALLGVDRVAVLYAHFRDPHTSVEDIARGFDELYKLGKFEKLGLCNFNPAELTEYFSVCAQRGYVKPSIIQDMYNPLYRGAEDELIPLIRKHGCKFYAYSPLAGGFLTGKVTPLKAITTSSLSSSATTTIPVDLEKTRFRGATAHPVYTSTYDSKEVMHDAVRALVAACDDFNSRTSASTSTGEDYGSSSNEKTKEKGNRKMTPTEATLRWLMNHSILGAGDAIILGAKTEDQARGNIEMARSGPLEDEGLREAVEGLWGMVR